MRSGGGAVVACVVAAFTLSLSCARTSDDAIVIRFWGMGREGEVVAELIPEFERENPGVRVLVQQVPWSAAHEKLLTGVVGKSTPDVSQLGNTWVPEFAALRSLMPVERVDPLDFFPGIWDTNVVDGTAYGVPWYVDTRVVFYRKDILADAGCTTFPTTWAEWRDVMTAIKKRGGEGKFGIFMPSNEWMQPALFGLQSGSPLLADNATRGVFSGAEFKSAFDFYIGLFRDGLAPAIGNNEIANAYQEFSRGYFAMWITGPWNLGEFRRRLPPEQQGIWGTAPIPGPDGPGLSSAGGSSLVVFRSSKHKEIAWKLVEFLTRPEQQARFFGLTGDLPARRSAWGDSILSREPNLEAFRRQLERVAATPKLPEWELIATRLLDCAEVSIRGKVPADSALAALDREVDRILEKRRWLLEHGRLHEGSR